MLNVIRCTFLMKLDIISVIIWWTKMLIRLWSIMLEGQGISPVCCDALVGRVIILNETYQLKNQIIIHMTLSVIECWLLSVKPLQITHIWHLEVEISNNCR